MRNIALLLTMSFFLTTPAVAASPLSEALAAIDADDSAQLENILASTNLSANARDESGATLLMVAAGRGHHTSSQVLLAAGADVFTVDGIMGVTPLHRAAQSGSLPIINALLAAGAHLDDRSAVNGHTPLLDAAFYQRYSAFELFLRAGADPSIPNTLGLTTWDWAERQNDAELLRLLQEQAARDAAQAAVQTMTAAAAVGDINGVQAALDQGEDVNQVTKAGNTPLHLASRNGHLEVVRVLLAAGAQPNTRDKVMRATAGHKAGFFGHAEILAELLAAGLNADLKGPYNGYTALHDAILNQHVTAARVLINGGASVTIVGIDGKSPRDLAFERGLADDLGIE